MKTHFYLTDIDYKIENDNAIIYLYGRTKEGQQITLTDQNFESYFYAIGTIDTKELEQIENVTKIEIIEKNLNEKPTKAYKIYVNQPKSVPIVKDAIKKIPTLQAYEYDILFTRRYLLDKQITPLTLLEAETQDNKILTIKQQTDETLKPKILTIDIETYNPDNKMDPKKNPILMVGLYGENYEKIITWKKFETKQKYIQFVPTEADMLQKMTDCINEYAPDFIVGYFTDGFDFPYIVERAKKHKIKLEIGPEKTNIQILGKTQPEAKIVGLPHIDIFKFIRKVIARSLKTDVYTLDAVAKELVGEGKHPINMEQFFKDWDDNNNLEEYCKYNLQDCILTYKLTQKLLPNLIEFVKVIKLTPYEINRMTFSTYVEWYLINKATQKEIIPNKPTKTEEMHRLTDRVKGAFVYEPTPGHYKNITVFDYRSLYPSIIASHNISKGTLNCKCCGEPKIQTDRGTYWYCQKQKGLFSTVISELILLRAELKKQIKTNKDPLLAARSEALKVLANSFYGYMGYALARYYCIECAESTTAWARHYIQKAINTTQKAGFRVLYSDTDSLFILLENKTKEDALKLIDDINKELPGLMEIDYEGYYPAGIFVGVKTGTGGAKKKYALLDEKGGYKIKGFESVRRNWSFIAKDTQRTVLEIILKENNPQKAKNYVRDVIENLRKNKTPKEKVVVHTALSKGTEAYASIGPHVAAAQKMEARGQKVGQGTIIKYIIVKGKGKIRDKVKLPDETTQEEYDGEYYIQNQIIPGVEKIFAVLDIKVDDLMSETKQSTLGGW